MKQIIKFITVPVLALICSVTALGQSDKSSIYTSNVTLPTSGTNASSCKVVINSTEYDGTKLGTSSKAGSASFSVPAGTKYIHLHVAAWNGKSPSFKYKVGNGSETTISGITSNSGIANNSPFTWSTSSGNQNPNSSYHYKVICLSTALASETSITFSSSDRVVFWGVNTETETVAPALVATPSFSPAEGEVIPGTTVTISCATAGAVIYYTTDGSIPTSASTEYSTPVEITSNTTLKAIAMVDDVASDVASATYTMSIPSISASDINLAYDATSGSIAFSITNPVEGGVLTAEITAGNTDSWMSLGEVGESVVAITCSENESETDERTATVTLTYTYNTDKTVSKDVVITQAKSVIDYAELPFSFDNGKDNLTKTTGLTQSGLGSDYNSSPKLKFDSSDDYVILKIKEDPGTLSFDIKGNSFSGGTFKIQTSVDGSDYSDLKTYTSLGDKQTEEFTNLESDVRYIKWIYTNKSNGNVALGKINLKKDTPFINLSSYSINVTDAEAEGILSATYKKVVAENSSDLEIQWFGEDGETPAEEPDWALVEINDDLNVDYFIEENTEDKARTAYFKVYGLDEEAGDVYSSLVAINQAAMSVASLPFSFTGGRSDIESTAGLTANGLDTDYGNNNPPLKFNDEGDYVLLHFTGAPASLSFDIRNNSFSGGTFIVQTSADGKTYNELLSYKSLEGTQNESCDLPSNVRFIKWVYSSKANGNVGLGNISVTAFDPSASSITLGAALNNGRYWVSFYNKSNRYILPSGSEAYTINSSNQLFRLGTDGSVIPAGTAVIIIADSASITLTKSNDESDVAVNGFTNILQGSNSPVTVSEIVGTPYVLGIKNGVLGFYEFVGETLPANKAYYVVNE